METEGSTAGSTLATYMHTLRRRAWILALCLVLVPAAALFVSERSAKQYQASAEVYANGDDVASILTGINTSSASGNSAENIVYLALTPRVARRTLRALDRTDRTPNYLLAQTSVLQKGGSDFFVVSVTDSDPTVAAQLATEYARQVIKYRSELATAALANARRLASRKLERLEADGKKKTFLYRSLKQKDQELETLEALQTSRLSVVRTPTSGYQIAPRPKRAAALGIFLALVLGGGLMVLVEALDTRVRSGAEIAERLDLPLLARIPAPPRKLAAHDELVMLAKPAGQHGESFRMLRTNLEFALLSGEARTILLTSAIPKEGKSTTAANLAVALARGGRRVAHVDLDLRRPHLNKFFRLPGTPGITDVVLGRETLENALTRVDLGTGLPAPASGSVNVGGTALAGHGSLDVLTSGPIPRDPGELVGTSRLSEILNALRDSYDLVVIDSPPMLRVGDVITLSTKVDALVVVSCLNLVRRQVLTEMRRLLDSIPIEKLGLVLAGADVERKGDYGYGYSSGFGDEDTVRPAAPDSEATETRV
jgi:succinoglycan biosynthesis transport protein ExoP